MATIGVDLGGTKILAVRVDDDGTAGEVVKVSTPTDRGPDGVIDAILRLVERLGRDGVDAVGVGSPGIIVPGLGLVSHAPNLPGWSENVPLGARLSDALQVPVVIENDVNTAIAGERAAGAARGQDDVLGLWLGTGVGAGLILDGRLRRGPNGAAGEIGHTVVQHGGRRCACGGEGHLEAYAGRAAMEAEARRRHAAGEPTLLVELAGDGRMKSGVFAKALAKGDRMANDLIDGAVTAIGVSLATAVMLIDVSFVVVGGGLAEKLGHDLVSRISDSAADLLPAGLLPGFTLASLGDESGALGAADMARDAAQFT